METTKCKGCGTEIIWIETTNSKKHPLNAKKESIWVHDGGNNWSIMTGHTSHFATCPKADEFRRSKRQETAKDSRKIDDKEVT